MITIIISTGYNSIRINIVIITNIIDIIEIITYKICPGNKELLCRDGNFCNNLAGKVV